MSRLGVAVALSAVAHAGVAAAVLTSRSAGPGFVLTVDLTRGADRSPDAAASPGGPAVRAAAGPAPAAGLTRRSRPDALGGSGMPDPRERPSAVGPSSPPPAEPPVATPAPESPAHRASDHPPVAPARDAPAVAPSTEVAVREPLAVAEALPPRAPEPKPAPETWSDRRASTRAPEALAPASEAPAPPDGSGLANGVSVNGLTASTGGSTRSAPPGPPGGDAASAGRSAAVEAGRGASVAGGGAAPPAEVAGRSPLASGEAAGPPGAGASAGTADAAGATAPAGRALGRATSEGGGDPGARYAAYLQRWRDRIQAALRYPPAARRRSVAGTVHLEITLDPAGRVREARVVRSAHPLLDEAALESVRALGPEPFPPDLPPRPLRVRLPVVFALE